MELRPHPKDCCSPIASLLLGVIFHALLRRVSVILNTVSGDQLKRSFEETSFVNRYINYNSMLEVEIN